MRSTLKEAEKANRRFQIADVERKYGTKVVRGLLGGPMGPVWRLQTGIGGELKRT